LVDASYNFSGTKPTQIKEEETRSQSYKRNIVLGIYNINLKFLGVALLTV